MTDNHIDDIHAYRRQLVDRKLWLDKLIAETEERMDAHRGCPVRYHETLRKRRRELVMLRHDVLSEIEEVSEPRS